MKEEIKTFANYLLQYNKKINLVSRNMSRDELYQLINESILIDQYISNDCIIDAGSGNGILGIPLALINENKKITLVEPKKKLITEVILITSENKIKKNKKSLESVEKKIYNIPLRNSLKILKLNPVMENYKSE